MIVYVASPDSREIHVFELDPAGALRVLQVVETPGQAQPLALSPNRQFLYAGVRPEHAVLTYAVAPDGKLALLAQAPLPGSPTYLSVGLDGEAVYCASYAGNVFSRSPIMNGVAQAADQIFDHVPCAHAAVPAPGNRFVLVPSLGSDRICTYRRDGDRLLADGYAATRHGAGPRHLVFHPSRPLAYCLNELDGHVDIWRFNPATGSLRPKQTINALPAGFAGKPWSADLHLSPDAHFLYATDRAVSTIAVMAVSEDGLHLRALEHTGTEAQPRGFAISPCGEFVVVAGQLSNHVALYRRDRHSGMLTLLQRQAAGQGPMWVAFR